MSIYFNCRTLFSPIVCVYFLFLIVASISSHKILTSAANQICLKKMWQIGVLEDTRNRTLHGILSVQSCYRGHLARRHLKELKRGISVLQSCINLPRRLRTNHFLVLGIQSLNYFNFSCSCAWAESKKRICNLDTKA